MSAASSRAAAGCTEYRIWLAGGDVQVAAESKGRVLKRDASKRCVSILQAHPDALRVEAWRDGRYITKSTRLLPQVAGVRSVERALVDMQDVFDGGCWL